MKGITNYIIILLLLVLIGLTLRNNKREIDLSTALAERAVEIIPVRTATVEKRRLDREIALAGIIKAEQNLMLMAQAQGRVIRTLVAEGQSVAAGDVIAIIDDSYLKAEAEVLTASLDKLTKDLERYKILAQNKAITHQQLEGVQLQYDNVKSQHDIMQRRIADTRVKTPIDGVLSKMLVDKGSMVGAGVPIAQILNQASYSISFAVHDNDIVHLSQGQQVLLTDIGFQNVTGSISKVASSKNRNGKYEVEASLQGHEGTPLKADMVRNAMVLFSDTTAHVMVPATAVIYRDAKRGVYQVNGDKVSFVPLSLSGSVYDHFIVAQGLSPGDQIVTEGQYRVAEGSTIKQVP